LVHEAIRFKARDVQEGLEPVTIAGNSAFEVDPNLGGGDNDFYKRVIDRRREVKGELTQAKAAKDKARVRALEGARLALKILANATSYGIFIELNVEDTDEDDKPFEVFTGQCSFTAKPKKREEPGEYFHPLLATLITGAARLMMAITEALIREEKLDWAFCDTDGIAIASPPEQSEEGFEGRVEKIRSWFEGLNPYEAKGSILDLEDENFHPETGEPDPLYCFAVSAKRYALFNRTADGQLIIWKASAHGLGHLLAPYKEDPGAINEP
jgi:DNA polymerase elongation subunit (family B)